MRGSPALRRIQRNSLGYNRPLKVGCNHCDHIEKVDKRDRNKIPRLMREHREETGCKDGKE